MGAPYQGVVPVRDCIGEVRDLRLIPDELVRGPWSSPGECVSLRL